MTNDVLGLFPETAKDGLARWDKGETVWMVEMGGLGPSYEQAIQVLAIELIREYQDTPPERDKRLPPSWGDSVVQRLDSLGFSGAQVGVAKQLASKILALGWREALASAPQNRLIQVTKDFGYHPLEETKP